MVKKDENDLSKEDKVGKSEKIFDATVSLPILDLMKQRGKNQPKEPKDDDSPKNPLLKKPRLK